MFLEMLAWQCRFGASLLHKLVDDIPEEKFFTQPTHLPNHPGWQIAHVSFVRASLSNLLGKPAPVAMEELQPFGPGTTPSTDPSVCKTKAHWLAIFDQVQNHILSLLPALTEEQLRQPPPERLRNRFTEVRQVLTILVGMHDGWHIGQLCDWRRAMGLPKVM